MTYREAIRFLEKKIASCHILRDRQWKEVYITSINAIEKQIPKKPIEDGYYDEPCVCPNCGSNVINEVDNDYQFEYCYHCGQSLDWSVDNG